LVHQHTMSDMIRVYLGEEKFKKADAIFKKQTNGEASMEEAFSMAGPLTAGLTLRQAIEYAHTEMRYVDGFEDLMSFLGYEIPFVINSTGYSVTIYVMNILWAEIHGQIGNKLMFSKKALGGSQSDEFSEKLIEGLIANYLCISEVRASPLYDQIEASGEVGLGIKDEAAKATLLWEYVKSHFPRFSPTQLVHTGDTMGDSRGILDVAKMGGTGIAFNYNDALEQFLRKEIEQDSSLSSHIYFVDRKSEDTADLRHLIPILKDLL